MMASYLLSRTLVPTMIRYLIPAELRFYQHGAEHEEEIPDAGIIWSIHHRFNNLVSSACATAIRACCTSTLAHRKLVLVLFLAVAVCCVGALSVHRHRFLSASGRGADSFARALPRRHAHRGNRTEIFAGGRFHPQNYSASRRSADILDNIGLPYSGFNLAFTDSVTLGSVRRRNSGFAQAGQARTDLGLRARNAPQAGARVSGPDVFLPARRYCRADSEFRIARADRRASGGAAAESRQELRYRAGDFAPPDQDSGRGRRARPPGERRAADDVERGPRARQPARVCSRRTWPTIR